MKKIEISGTLRGMKKSDYYIQQIFGTGKPGSGTIKIEKSRQPRDDDINLATYFIRKFGGDYTIISDIAPQGAKPPDILLSERAIFENKNVSSVTSIDSQTKKALLQLDHRNLVLLRKNLGRKTLKHVLVISVNPDFVIDAALIFEIVLHRINRYASKRPQYIDFVIIKRKNSSIRCFEVPKKSP